MIEDTLSIANGGFVSKEQREETIRRQILRDHFAGLAMQALIGKYAVPTHELISQRAYEVADAMLKAREKK